MEFSSPDQFLGLLALASFALALGLWLSARHANRRDAERQRCLALAIENERNDPAEQPIIVGDYGRMAALPEALYEDLFDHLDRRRRWPAAPNDTWRPAQPDDTPGALVPGEGDIEPQPTLGQERLYDAEGLVQYGLSMVHQRCRDARRDAATDHVCQPCGKIFAAVTA